MTTIVFTVPTDLKDFLAQQVKTRGFSSPADYILDLLRQAKNVHAQAEREQKFIDDIGLPRNSLGGAGPFDDGDEFDETIRD
jgi:Arc/MetJ-type ribon-helix-helix transcriptional regulator